jgi:large subunit ribosomal protein L25
MPGDLPDAIDIDISALEVGDSLTVADVVPPKGVAITSPAEEVLCSVTPPTVAPVEEEAAQVVEPEVVGEEKEEE